MNFGFLNWMIIPSIVKMRMIIQPVLRILEHVVNIEKCLNYLTMRKPEKPFGLINHPSHPSQIILVDVFAIYLFLHKIILFTVDYNGFIIFCFKVRITEAKQKITPFNVVLMSFNLIGLGHIIYLYYIHIII